MSRRGFVQAALLSGPLATAGLHAALAEETPPASPVTYTLPPLAYHFDALEPHIDAMTMQIHHDKHHATYVKNLNDAIAAAPDLAARSPEALIAMLGTIPEPVRGVIRNNAGGHVNHSLFWALMSPKGSGTPSGPLGEAIVSTFGSVDNFQAAFVDAGVKRFGSGWVWLARDPAGKLQILTTPYQDNPLMAEYGGLYPILGNDLWEHAYYLKYQNRRAEYLKAWWNVVNWDVAAARFATA